MKLIIASNNKGKVREYKQILSGLGFDEVLSLKDAGIECNPDETGKTFAENAAIKARALKELCKDVCVLADDSGLTVDALGGEPGVYSARWLGLTTDKEKNDEILRRLDSKRDDERGAAFVCAIHFIYADGREVTACGECRGVIGYEPRGENGFGYDPIFMYGDKSFAELDGERKNALSHRGKALENLVRQLDKNQNIPVGGDPNADTETACRA